MTHQTTVAFDVGHVADIPINIFPHIKKTIPQKTYRFKQTPRILVETAVQSGNAAQVQQVHDETRRGARDPKQEREM